MDDHSGVFHLDDHSGVFHLDDHSDGFHLDDYSGGVVERQSGGKSAAAILMQRNQVADAEGAAAAVAAVASTVMGKSVRHRQVGE